MKLGRPYGMVEVGTFWEDPLVTLWRGLQIDSSGFTMAQGQRTVSSGRVEEFNFGALQRKEYGLNY